VFLVRPHSSTLPRICYGTVQEKCM
jgi:hypothetical protein